MGEAVRIEQRLHHLFAGMRHGARRQPESESPREVERRAMEQLYPERSFAVVLAERESAKQSR